MTTSPVRVKTPLPFYSVSEEIGNAVTHGAGALLAAAGTVLLLVKSAGDPWNVTASAIYGAAMFLLFAMSTLYHAITNARAKRFLRILDHSTIFLLIAGTYTPFTLITLRGTVGWTIFGIVWGVAAAGITLNLISVERFKKLSMAGYIASGWCIVLAMVPLVRAMAWQGVLLLFLGGVFYTGGVLFYRRKNVPYMHMIWHFFVLAGAAAHYFCIAFYVV